MSSVRPSALVVLAATSSLALASAALAQTPHQNADPQTLARNNPPSAQMGQNQPSATAPFTRINVATASSIVGQPVLDQSGQRIGEIDYLMIDPVDGRISFVVIGRGGTLDLGEQLIPVPWGHLDVVPGESRGVGRITLDRSAPRLDQAPRISMDTLRQLTEPTFVTRVLTFFAPVNTAQGAGTPGQGHQAQRPATPTPGVTPQQQAQTPPAGAQQAPDRQRQAGQSADNTIVVGRAIITTLGPPLVDWRSSIVGAMVVSPDGREIGDIDQLVIDVDRGHVAYAMLASGGFLGLGETLKPVPLQALTWRSQGTWVLNLSNSDLAAVPNLNDTAGNSRVRREDIASLYRRFNVAPYWQG